MGRPKEEIRRTVDYLWARYNDPLTPIPAKAQYRIARMGAREARCLTERCEMKAIRLTVALVIILGLAASARLQQESRMRQVQFAPPIIISSPQAVSYTHLDVYKRQGRKGGIEKPSGAVSFLAAGHVAKNKP